MKRLLPLLVPALVFTIGVGPLQAVSTPFIQGQVSGLEVCEQASPCGAAVFVAAYIGRVGNIPLTFGFIGVSVNHDPLPTPGNCADVTGGSWDLFAAGRHIHGDVESGTLFNTGLNTYIVRTTLSVDSGGEVYFVGLLDHTQFPPRIGGSLLQIPPPDPCVL